MAVKAVDSLGNAFGFEGQMQLEAFPFGTQCGERMRVAEQCLMEALQAFEEGDPTVYEKWM
ncbi:hypothetical protein [Rhodohalobacter sp.]|uniref:hypothetical protein n=1 Tax=Rhodohalobacter sp. TaxID=1974210 RepID=UPI002ACDC169|nr:hypothetical protein [Rhodohalobacter sp.]MDZ7756737.1 hypothetical protein [Rhodohalobacter sp.]